MHTVYNVVCVCVYIYTYISDSLRDEAPPCLSPQDFRLRNFWCFSVVVRFVVFILLLDMRHIVNVCAVLGHWHIAAQTDLSRQRLKKTIAPCA